MDEELKTEWTIFPFAFLLRDGGRGRDGIVIDWEHTTYAFVPPEDVDKHDTVPHLSISLERVLVAKTVAEGLKKIKNDHDSGARMLAGKAVEVIRNAVRDGDVRGIRSVSERKEQGKESMRAWWRGLRMIGWHLKMVRESMGAAITVAVCGSLRVVEQELSIWGSLEEVRKGALERLEDDLEHRLRNSERIGWQFGSWLNEPNRGENPTTILTLSSSSTIRACLVAAISGYPHCRIRLKIMESRPLFEGVAFVQSLLMELGDRGVGDRVEVEIASDASVGCLAKDADMVLLGADRISEDGDVSNKIGSLAAVLCAKELSKDVKIVVVSELDKIAGHGKMENHKVEDNDISELTKHWPSASALKVTSDQWKSTVKVKNVYFEWVPARYIDSYVSEIGVLNLEGIRSQSMHVTKMEEEMFGDL